MFPGASGARDLAWWLFYVKKTFVMGKHVHPIIPEQRKRKSAQKAWDMCHEVVPWPVKCLMTSAHRYACVRVWVCGWVYGWVWVCVHVRPCVSRSHSDVASLCGCACLHVHECWCVCVFLCVRVCVCVYMNGAGWCLLATGMLLVLPSEQL